MAEALSRKGAGASLAAASPSAITTAEPVSEHPPALRTPSAPEDSQTRVSTSEPAVTGQPRQLPANLAELREAACKCADCALSAKRKNVVFGVGSEHPDVLFIGEAPGEQEDVQGEPFVGRAGQLLDRMLDASGWSRDSVYIMNVVKCRPPGNRDPKPGEVRACSRWFDAQWDLLQPRVVCLLGRVAAQRVLGTEASLSSLRGRWHEYRGVPVWVTYHPAYLLRTPTGKAAVWQDLRVLAERVQSLRAPVSGG